jgi:hypothetical protein
MPKFEIILKTILKSPKEIDAIIDMCKRDIDIPKLVHPKHIFIITKFLDTALNALSTPEVKKYVREYQILEEMREMHIIEISHKSITEESIKAKFPLLNSD